VDDETREALKRLAFTLNVTIEMVAKVMETQTAQQLQLDKQGEQIDHLSQVTQRLLELQRHEYTEIDRRLRDLES